jgi:uncharacterized membrane protein YhdT
MADEEKKKAYLFYTDLNNKNEIQFQHYTECSSIYDKGFFFNVVSNVVEFIFRKIQCFSL